MTATRQICIPVLQPAAGSYCPPLLITCLADLQQFEELWVIITTPKQRISQLYKSPFMIDDVGRVQLSAFVRRPGICDGPSTSAIFELSLSAPPLGKTASSAMLQRAGAANLIGGCNGTPMLTTNTFVNHGLGDSSMGALGTGLNLSVGGSMINGFGQGEGVLTTTLGGAAGGGGASMLMSGGAFGNMIPGALTAPHANFRGSPNGPNPLAIPTCQFTSATSNAAVAVANSAPTVMYSLKATDMAIAVCDASGAPIALMDPPTSAVVVLDVPAHGAVLTCKANVEVVGAEVEKVLPSFQSLTDLMVSRETAGRSVGGVNVNNNSNAYANATAVDTSSSKHQSLLANDSTTAEKRKENVITMSMGKTSSRADINGALGITAPEIGVLSNAKGCGIMFRINYVLKGCIGIDEPHNAEDVRRGMRNDVAHSFHFNGDVTISNAGEGLYKISDRTEPTKSIETRPYRIGDCFSITMRPSGDVDYIHNDRIIYTSRAKSGIESLMAMVVRVHSEGSTPSIGDIALVPPRYNQKYVIPSLVYNGPSGEGVMRVWLSGREFAPATAKVRLTSSSLPRWAFSAFSVASMFAVGAFGCDGTRVAEAMVATESDTLQLFQIDPNAATGQEYPQTLASGEVGRSAPRNMSQYIARGGGGSNHSTNALTRHNNNNGSRRSVTSVNTTSTRYPFEGGAYSVDDVIGKDTNSSRRHNQNQHHHSSGRSRRSPTNMRGSSNGRSGGGRSQHADPYFSGEDDRHQQYQQQHHPSFVDDGERSDLSQTQRPKGLTSNLNSNNNHYPNDYNNSNGVATGEGLTANELERRHQRKLGSVLGGGAAQSDSASAGGDFYGRPSASSRNANSGKNPFYGIGTTHGAVNPLDMLVGGGGGGKSNGGTKSNGGGGYGAGGAANAPPPPQAQLDTSANGTGGMADRSPPPRLGGGATAAHNTNNDSKLNNTFFRNNRPTTTQANFGVGGGAVPSTMDDRDRSHSLASLASHKRRALDAVFGE